MIHSAPRVVVIGVDAGDPELVEQWVREGRLPAMTRLIERGMSARTSGPDLVCEHGVWVSLFSGVSRRAHGFNFFRQLRPGTYELELVSGATLGVQPLWAKLPDGMRVLIVDAPDIPPIPGVAGRQLAEWATHSHYPPIPLRATPRSLLDEAEALSGRRDVIAEEIGATEARDREIVEQLIARVPRKGALIRGLMAREPADLVVACFAETHTAGHQAWEYRRHANGDGPRDARALQDGLFRIYEAVDREIGLIVDTLPADTTVFVVGSVGLRSQYPTEALAEQVCRTLGWQASPNHSASTHPQGLASRALRVLRALLPESLRLVLSRALSLEQQAQLVSEKFRAATDWSRTRAFVLPGYYSSAIRLNLKGREPQGIVDPLEATGVLDAIERDFLSLTHAETGESVVDHVLRLRADDMYGADAHLALPDLLVIWREHERPIVRVRHGAQVIEQQPHAFHRGSDHSATGFLVAAGGRVEARGPVGDVSPLALAPSVLTALGVPVPATMATPPLFS